MKLTYGFDDANTIQTYIRISRPEYKGPIIVFLPRLIELHESKSELVVTLALLKAKMISKEK